MKVKIMLTDKPTGKVADAELHFGSSGPLAGLKLIGFSVWESRGKRTVTFPARQYSVNGERRTFALLRPVADTTTQDELKNMILVACDDAIVDARVQA